MKNSLHFFSFFFFNDTATTEIYTLSLHDALPICVRTMVTNCPGQSFRWVLGNVAFMWIVPVVLSTELTTYTNCPFRSEEHTSELQSRSDLVCRLLLEKKKKNAVTTITRLRTTPQV